MHHHLRQFTSDEDLEDRQIDRQKALEERRLCDGHKIINLKVILKGMDCLAEEINTKSLDAIRHSQLLSCSTLFGVGSSLLVCRQEGT